MGHLLTTRHRSAAGSGLEALQNGAILDKGELDGQGIGREVVIILSVCDSALERFGDELRGLARNQRKVIEGFGGFAALNDAGNVTHFFRRHARVASEGLNFHGGDGDE